MRDISKSLRWLPVCICGFFAVYGCSKKSEIVATFDGEKITLQEFNKRLETSPVSYRKYLSSPQGKKQFLDLMIREKLVMREAKNAGVTGDKEYKESVKRFTEEMKKRLRDFKENLIMEMFIRRLHEKELNPTEAEVRAYYEKNKNDFKSPFEMSVSHILLPDSKLADEVLDKLKKGNSFEALAEMYSTDPTSSHRGGALGSVKKGELTPELEAAARALKVGAYSGAVKSEYGYHILKKTGEKVLPEIKYEDTKEEIRRILVKAKFDAWIKKMTEKNKVNINQDVLEKAGKFLEGSATTEDQ